MKIFRFSEVSSTNDAVLDKLSSGEMPIFAVSAETQTRGRGHHGHSWVSEKGNLILSFALDVDLFLQPDLQIFPQCFALKFVQNIPVRVGLKWPNDIFYKKKKIGGVLLETRFEKMSLKYIVFGVGINVAVAPNIKNVSNYRAGALSEVSKKFTLAEIEKLTIRSLLETVELVKNRALIKFLQENWKIYDQFYGREIVVRAQNQQFYGIDKGINDQGALILLDKDGKLRSFNSAESEIIIDC